MFLKELNSNNCLPKYVQKSKKKGNMTLICIFTQIHNCVLVKKTVLHPQNNIA